MSRIQYSEIALDLDVRMRREEFDGYFPTLRQLTEEYHCSFRTLERALFPFRRCGALITVSTRETRFARNRLPGYSIGIVGDFTPSPQYDDSKLQSLYHLIQNHGGSVTRLSFPTEIKERQFSLFTTCDGLCFISPSQLYPQFADYLNARRQIYVTRGDQPGCPIRDAIGHDSFSAEAKFLALLAERKFRRIELWHPCIKYAENECRQRRWILWKKKLELPVTSGDRVHYEWQQDFSRHLRTYLEFHVRDGQWPEAVILWHGFDEGRKKIFEEYQARIPREVLFWSPESPFLPDRCRSFKMELDIAEELLLLGRMLFRRILFPEHALMYRTIPVPIQVQKLSKPKKHEKNMERKK